MTEIKNPINIVIVDDNVSFCEAMYFLAETFDDLQIICFNNSADFLNAYSEDWQGVLLLDIFMPDMDGFAVLEKLKRKKHKMHIIVISGHAVESKVRMYNVDFLKKPFNALEFLQKIRQQSSQYNSTESQETKPLAQETLFS